MTTSNRSLYRESFGKRVDDTLAAFAQAKAGVEQLHGHPKQKALLSGIKMLGASACLRLRALSALAHAGGGDHITVTVDDMVSLIQVQDNVDSISAFLATTLNPTD